MIILGIETSCDETAASVVKGRDEKVEVLSNVVSSQIEIHKKYGGVVPEAAAREHVLNILPVINEALLKAGVIPFNKGGKGDLFPLLTKPASPDERASRGGERVRPARNASHSEAGGVRSKSKTILLDALAVTVGPGLITSLQVGVETAKSLAYAWKLPIVGINHIEGHIYANFIGENHKSQILNPKQMLNHKSQTTNNIKFPAVILTVSGGHTMLILMTGHGKYKLLGETRDDAAGEAFDKAAQLLNLGYPGGPAIAVAASKSKIQNQKSKILLPRPMLRDKNLDFSFSGLKTALLYAIRRDKNWQKKIPEYAYEFQQAVVDVLAHKTIKAAQAQNCQTIMLSGGVAANLELRQRLKNEVKKNLARAKLIIPDLKYCTDNAAMIAVSGYFRARRQDFTPWQKLKTDANLELK